jgi:hypothetical protein
VSKRSEDVEPDPYAIPPRIRARVTEALREIAAKKLPGRVSLHIHRGPNGEMVYKLERGPLVETLEP